MGKVGLIDSCLLHVEEENIGLLLLSACKAPPTIEPNGHEYYTLFLHYLECSLTGPPVASKQRGVLAVGVDSFDGFSAQVRPRLHTVDSSTLSKLVISTWVTRGTFRACQVDVSLLDFVSISDAAEDRTNSAVDIVSATGGPSPLINSGVKLPHM